MNIMRAVSAKSCALKNKELVVGSAINEAIMNGRLSVTVEDDMVNSDIAKNLIDAGYVVISECNASGWYTLISWKNANVVTS